MIHGNKLNAPLFINESHLNPYDPLQQIKKIIIKLKQQIHLFQG